MLHFSVMKELHHCAKIKNVVSLQDDIMKPLVGARGFVVDPTSLKKDTQIKVSIE